MTKLKSSNFIVQIADLLSEARQNLVHSVNHTMVLTYFEIGRIIVEEEQRGNERADYGKNLLKKLSTKLTKDFGKGFSVENLDRMRFFYKAYATEKAISSTVLTKSKKTKANSSTVLTNLEKKEILNAKFRLSWSHYLKLMRIDDVQERSFYEIESFKNNWSLRELNRQYDSALFTRLALSKNKKGVAELAAKGQIIQNPNSPKNMSIITLNYLN